MTRRLLSIAGVIVGILVVVWLALRTPDIPAEELRAKYANAASEFVEVEPGLRLHVRDEGPKDAPAIVLLHGSSASLHTWEPWVQRLRGDYRVISLDQAGHGLTGPHPRDCYTADCFVAALEALRAAKGIDRFVVAGSSMGGWVAWNYAVAHPEHVRGLVLVSASGTPVGPTKLPIGFRIARMPVVRDIVRDITPRAIVERSIIGTVADPGIVTPKMVETYWELLRYPGTRRATALRSAAPRTTATPEVLARIKAPTLILWGSEDTLTPVGGASHFERGIAGSRAVVFEGVGHLPHEEVPDRSVAEVRRFLAALPPA